MSRPLKIGIVAGEPSGDLLGAKLMQALQAKNHNLTFEGIGGPAMMAAGCHSLFNIENLSIMGMVEPLFNLKKLLKIYKNLYRHFAQNRPDVFIGVDAPDFNLNLEFKLKKLGIPIIHYVSPSVWAWRRYRVKKIAETVDLMLTLLPFEAKFYQQYKIPVSYVGHPLADSIPVELDKKTACETLGIDDKPLYIALLPGSRKQELSYMSELFLKAANLILKQKPKVKFLTAHINGERYQQFYDFFRREAPNLPLQFFTRRSQDIMAAADVVIVTSGTATLETLLYKKPMVIGYRMSPVTYQLAKWLVKTPYIGLPNLLANQLLVPELIQKDLTAENIAKNVLEYLNQPEKMKTLKQTFQKLHLSLQSNSASCIAESVFSLVRQNK